MRYSRNPERAKKHETKTRRKGNSSVGTPKWLSTWCRYTNMAAGKRSAVKTSNRGFIEFTTRRSNYSDMIVRRCRFPNNVILRCRFASQAIIDHLAYTNSHLQFGSREIPSSVCRIKVLRRLLRVWRIHLIGPMIENSINQHKLPITCQI